MKLTYIDRQETCIPWQDLHEDVVSLHIENCKFMNDLDEILLRLPNLEYLCIKNTPIEPILDKIYETRESIVNELIPIVENTFCYIIDTTKIDSRVVKLYEEMDNINTSDIFQPVTIELDHTIAATFYNVDEVFHFLKYDVEYLKPFKFLAVHIFTSLESIRDIFKFTQLETLIIFQNDIEDYGENVIHEDDIKNMTNLKILELEVCGGLNYNFDIYKVLPNLECFSIS